MATETERAASEELGARLRDLRQTAGLTQRELAERVGYSRARVAGAESGEGCAPLFWAGCDKVLSGGGVLMAGFRTVEALRRRRAADDAAAAQAERASRVRAQRGEALDAPSSAVALRGGGLDLTPTETNRRLVLGQSLSGLMGERRADADLLVAAEAVRRKVEDTLAKGTISAARLDRLGETVAAHVRLYTTTAPAQALAGLLVDFLDVRRIAAKRQPASTQARLSEITALLGTLAADALMKLGRVADANSWYGTARIAADDSGNQELRARVRAQEAMLPYYYGQPLEAVRLAREAQEILDGLPRAAGALAAAAEARALARLGSAAEARTAIARAESLVDRISEPDGYEAFTFGARRLFFYASSTFSNLGDVTEATRVQGEALASYGDRAGLIDPALIRCDQAQVLIADGDVRSAGDLVEGALLSVPPAQRTLIFGVRLQQIIAKTPLGHSVHRMLTDLQHQLIIESAEGTDARGG
jgi:tetratricopeptide (TPR) repeat protein/DNA-binding XRE family transcriptional regulator